MPIINREKAEALIQEQITSTIFQDTPKQSTFMALARKLPNMTSKQTRIPVLDLLPMAYWVNGDTGFKQTSHQAWDNVYLTAAELAVIVPIPEAVIEDASFDIMGEVQPRITESIGKRVDEAVIFGINRPGEWTNDLITYARQAGNNVSDGADLFSKILGTDGVFGKVEQSGYFVNGVISSVGMRAKLRGLKDEQGHPIFMSSLQGATQYALDGSPMYFPTNGGFDNSVAQLVAGDFSQAVYAIRQDITVKLLDQGVIQDPTTKAIIYNLAQQDMVALRVVFRMGWALPNPATRLNEDRILVPFAYLEPTTAATTYTYTVTVQDNTDAAIAGATVDVNGSRLKTNASGQAVFNLRASTYPVKVKANGYTGATGSVTITNTAATAEFALTANA